MRRGRRPALGGGSAAALIAAIGREAVLQDEFVIAPGGWRPRSQVHLVPAGDAVAMAGHAAVPVRCHDRPGVPEAANWITCGYWANRSGRRLTSLVSRWVVPPAPARQVGQLLYLFTGMQPADGSAIVQPVLQWGDSGVAEDGINRTGPFWTVASWLVPAPDGHAYHTPHIRVRPGDGLTGAVTRLWRSSQGSVYRAGFLGLPGSEFVTPPIRELEWCVQALEAYEPDAALVPPYDLAAAREYPDAERTEFRGIEITLSAGDGPLPACGWMPWDIVESWGEHAVIVRNGLRDAAIDLHFGFAAAGVGPSAPE